jgi:type I restriction enzyme S subunit
LIYNATDDAPAWKSVALGQLASFRNGINFRADSFGPGIRIVGVGDFGDRVAPDYDALTEVSEGAVSSAESLLRDGDILAVRSNGNRMLIGRTMFIRRPPPVTHSAFTIRIRVSDSGRQQLLPEFLAYALRGPAMRSLLSREGHGTNISNLSQDILSRLPLRLPRIATQRKIAAILSTYDDLIENNNRRIRVLEEMAQRIYREWFVEFRYPGHRTVPLVDSELGPIPDGWTVCALSSIAETITRGVSPRYADSSDQLVINQRCIRDGKLDTLLARPHVSVVPATKMVRPGDVLVNSTGVGTLGRVAQVLFSVEGVTVDSHVTIVRAATDLAETEFFGLMLLAREAELAALGVGSTGQTELGRGAIGAMKVVLPPRQLQAEFADAMYALRRLPVSLAVATSRLRATRDLLLPRLISGEIDVTDLDIGVPDLAA